ncbi:hypothetical protein HDV57DRAFT_40807 [Trichoderma longibrachiatum]|uniref:Uncharacterized protein n=1 Tax=Trichoderma longibrachiatum ATCC 18648 TaxID=983965 RepID=A0A2T4CHF8_TRILO|nr:hypothetical protein M440DRAFT_1004714 [Trichoderma longibrachiatum ATCC 18648]
MAPARTAGRSVIGGAPLAVSRMMDPTQWLVSRSTNTMQLPPFECLPPRQQQPWTAQAPRRLEHHSHQAFIGNPLGSLPYGFRPYNTGHESKSALCTLCHSTKKDQSATVCRLSAFGTDCLITFVASFAEHSSFYHVLLPPETKRDPSMIDSWKAASGINRYG